MVNMDEKATVIFPETPAYSDRSGNKVWTAEIDSASRCMAMVLDFENYGWDTAQIAEEFNNPNAFEEFKSSILNKMDGATIIGENERTEGGVTCFEFVIDMGNESGEINYLYTKNYFTGTKMYTLSFYQAEEKEDEVAERFFKSFKVKEL